MPAKCVIPACKGSSGGHKFPRDRIIREKWIAAIRSSNLVVSEYSVVCKKHFKKDDYRLPKESMLKYPTPVLKKDAVPSRFLWNRPRCSVLSCRADLSKNIILHSCPKQESMRRSWAEVFKVNREVVNNLQICSNHFLPTDYRNTKNVDKVLKNRAVPSQKLPRSARDIRVTQIVVDTKKKPKAGKKVEKMSEAVVEKPKVVAENEVNECRACLKTMEEKNSVCNIFQTWVPPWTGMEATIAEDLAKLANVEVTSTDKHSKVICQPCYLKLLDAARFAAKVRQCDDLLRQRCAQEVGGAEKVWPKPIQVDKNLNGEVFQDMDIEIKQEVVSDDEYTPIPAENSYPQEEAYLEGELGNAEIKIEPEDYVEPPPLTITINGTKSLDPSNPEDRTLLNGTAEYEAIITEGMENTALSNGIEHSLNVQYLEAKVKEEPLSEEEDHELVPDLSLECLLCTKSFNSVTGLKAHVIAQHSYKSVKRKAGSGDTPEKKPKDEYRCQICRRWFVTSTDLMVHETCHNKYSCYGCSRKFDTFKQLSKHRKRCQVPLSKSAAKPKTLDDVKRPVIEGTVDTPHLETIDTAREDSNDSSKPHLELHSVQCEASMNTEAETNDSMDTDTQIETLDKEFT